MKNYQIPSLCILITLSGCVRKHENDNLSNKLNKPNILFICIDDLRRELGAYGSIVKTPYIDHLAADGSLFFHHFAQVPTSGASRASMLTGYLPKKDSDLSNEACRLNLSDQPEGEKPETLFHHLKRNGYYTVGIGKISHYADGYLYGYTAEKSDKLELPYSWNEMLFNPGKWGNGWNAFFGYSDGTNRQSRQKQVKPYECAEVDDKGLPDGLTAELAVNKLKELAQKDQPFCLAVGFFKPHLPFTAPKKYWDLYDEESIPLSPTPDIPTHANPIGLHESGEFNGYLLGEEKASLKKSVSEAYARRLRHAYYACISYTDAQVGKILQALEETGKAENTIIVLWGDHGWHLGDQRVWGKHSLYETSLGSTLVIKVPGALKGVKNKRIVSSVDIYPTLMELCNIQQPEGLDGHSFASLLTNPSDTTWKDISYSYQAKNKSISMRTKDYRITRYKSKGKEIIELYKYDEDRLEKENIAAKKPEVIKELLPKLNKREFRK